MTVRNKGAWILAGLAALGATLVGGQEAHAWGGIAVTGGYKVGTGDPPYDYIFQVYLEPGGSILAPSLGPPVIQDSFTIENLPGVTSSSSSSVTLGPGFSSPANSWAYPTFTATTNPYGSNPSFAANVQWAYNGLAPIDNTTNSSILLGQFTVVSTYDFSNGPPVVSGTIIDFNYDIGGGTNSGSGSFPIVNLGSVPEPSSMILLVAGIAWTLPIVWNRRRRLRQRQSQSHGA
jgi:hypothetical protein